MESGLFLFACIRLTAKWLSVASGVVTVELGSYGYPFEEQEFFLFN
jgi:hypothetical protein